jgi:hypothetical protein
MAKYAKKYFKYIRKGARVAMILITSASVYSFILVRDNAVSSFLSKIGIKINDVFSFITDKPYFLPILILSAFFVWAFYKVVTEHNWDDVLFENVNPAGISFPYARIKVENTNNEYIKKCRAELESFELLQDFRHNKYMYDSDKHVLPVNLAWVVDGKEIYTPIDIDRNGKCFISVAVSDPLEKDALAIFSTNVKGGSPIVSMHAGEYRAKIKVYADINDEPLAPIVLDKTIYFQDGRLFLKDFVASKTATQQSVHLTGGILRRFQAFLKRRVFSAPKQNLRPPTRK